MIVASRLFDSYVAAPRLDRGARRQSSQPSAGLSLPPRRGDGCRPPRRVFFGWLCFVADPSRSQPMSFRRLAASSPMPGPANRRMLFVSPSEQDGAGGDTRSLAGHERMRAALGRTVAAVQAAHYVGEGAPNNGARGTS